MSSNMAAPLCLSPAVHLTREFAAGMGDPRNEKGHARSVANPVENEIKPYLILPSLYSTCLRTTGSYLLTTIFSVIVRAFFLVT